MTTAFEKLMVDGAHKAYPYKKPMESYKRIDDFMKEDRANFFRVIAFQKGFMYCVEVFESVYGIDVYKMIAKREFLLKKESKKEE